MGPCPSPAAHESDPPPPPDSPATTLLLAMRARFIERVGEDVAPPVKKQPSQDVLHGNAAEEELSLARLRGRQTARSKVLSRHARDT